MSRYRRKMCDCSALAKQRAKYLKTTGEYQVPQVGNMGYEQEESYRKIKKVKHFE